MTTRLYVGSLSYDITEREVHDIFAAYGNVRAVDVVKDREQPGKNRGFAFVEMETEKEAQAAIDGLDRQQIGLGTKRRQVRVQIAEPRRRHG